MARINGVNQMEKQLPPSESKPGQQNDMHTQANNRETPLLDPDFTISFGKDDPDDPRNFGSWHKVYITCQLSMLTFVAALGSSILSPGQSDVAEYTNISSEVAVLATSMYILGWAVGPTLWGPISEVYGRKWGMLPALFCLGLFSIGTAVSQNAASIFITRFIGGIFGSAPISNANAALSDIYAPKERGIAVAFMMLCITGGPSVGPLIGSAVYPIVFEEVRGYSPVIASLPFLGILVGTACAVGITFAYRTRYAKAVMDNGGKAVPEARLPPLVLGVIFLPTGLFWLGWTAAPKFSWVLPTVGGVFVGAGHNIIFQQCINYLIDTYGPYAASAISANTMLRSFVAAGLPLAAKPMFHNLGVGPAASLMGGIACLAFPIPFVFMKYGRTLREKSKFAPASSD
ncbi:bicyclomycin resistance protein [Aspergillus luchuensis]|uniref:Bicyclomycin resistance protein n=1 Tax=Aspergillus kawachii TaxID=1069201 RepID=A0A146FAM3_ASPKA|nr:bicyclomycin resistance protein [Aspergillus luchuensis]